MEFVNDHDQARWWIDHIADIGSMDSGGQLFTACQFGFQRTQRAYGMRQIQIAYAAHGMRQPFEFAERGTAFESKNTKFRCSGPFIEASARHQLCSNTDFPEPVVPATRACGP